MPEPNYSAKASRYASPTSRWARKPSASACSTPGPADKVLPHPAFGSSYSLVFVLGLPGAGKSRARERLAQKLSAIGVESREFTDYLYAFRDHLHDPHENLSRPEAQDSRPARAEPSRLVTNAPSSER